MTEEAKREGLRECECGASPRLVMVTNQPFPWLLVAGHSFDCRNYGHQIPLYGTEAEAIAAWNTRSKGGDDALVERAFAFVRAIATADREGWNDATIDEARAIRAALQEQSQ